MNDRSTKIVTEVALREMYIKNGFSVKDIARRYKCSENKINYWLQKFGIKKRSIADALYQKNNPKGNPFSFSPPKNYDEVFLLGLGLGLYWGEGNKVNKTAVRIGNTDPDMQFIFLKFLTDIFNIEKSKLRFGLQIFSSDNPEDLMTFWRQKLQVSAEQFHSPTVTKKRGKGTYTSKKSMGVLTIYFSNVKLRDMIVGAIAEMQSPQNGKYATVAQLVERIHGESQRLRPVAGKSAT